MPVQYMPEAKRQAFVSVLGRLKQRVIWKWEGDLPGLPPNVRTLPWLPQPDLLGHPKVLVFVTHGGAGSLQDTICHKTPILGIPIAGDQVNNIVEAETKGFAYVIRLGQGSENQDKNKI